MRMFLASVLGGLVVLAGLSLFSAPRKMPTGQVETTVFERVMASHTLRCGYVAVPPRLIKDPNTGQMSGLLFDLVNATGKALGIAVAWTEETTFAAFVEGLKADRYDAFCGGLYGLPPALPHVETSLPYYFSPVNIYARKGFSSPVSPEALNAPAVRVAVLDGSVPDFLARSKLPRATRASLPDVMDYAHILLALDSNKADITFLETSIAQDIFAAHPNLAARRLEAFSPVAAFPVTLAVRKGEHALVGMLSDTIRYLHLSGEIEAILRAHEGKGDNAYLRVSPFFAPARP